MDDRGWLYLKGREREEINKGGMKVHPADIDAVAERFEPSPDVCTFGFEDPLLGENVGIAVVLKEPMIKNTEPHPLATATLGDTPDASTLVPAG